MWPSAAAAVKAQRQLTLVAIFVINLSLFALWLRSRRIGTVRRSGFLDAHREAALGAGPRAKAERLGGRRPPRQNALGEGRAGSSTLKRMENEFTDLQPLLGGV